MKKRIYEGLLAAFLGALLILVAIIAFALLRGAAPLAPIKIVVAAGTITDVLLVTALLTATGGIPAARIDPEDGETKASGLVLVFPLVIYILGLIASAVMGGDQGFWSTDFGRGVQLGCQAGALAVLGVGLSNFGRKRFTD